MEKVTRLKKAAGQKSKEKTNKRRFRLSQSLVVRFSGTILKEKANTQKKTATTKAKAS